jgi:hypothetical protein
VPERWPGRLEVFPLQNPADQRLLIRIEDTGSLRSPAARPTQAFNGPGLPNRPCIFKSKLVSRFRLYIPFCLAQHTPLLYFKK